MNTHTNIHTNTPAHTGAPAHLHANAAPPMVISPAVMRAADRLSVSRVHLRQALMPPHHAPGAGEGDGDGDGDGSSRPTFLRWLDRLSTAPLASIVINTVQRWWAKHPMRLAVLLADDAARTLVKPVAKKHPYRLVLGAGAVGALLMVSRSWRWLPRAVLTPALTSTLMAGLVPTLISQLKSPAAGSAWGAHSQ